MEDNKSQSTNYTTTNSNLNEIRKGMLSLKQIFAEEAKRKPIDPKPKVKKEGEAKSVKKPKKEIKEKKSSNTDLELNENVERKWADHKSKENVFKGAFSKEEKEIIKKSLCDFMLKNNKTKEDIVNLIVEKQVKTKNSSFWCQIAEKLPNRSVEAIHKFCHRLLHPDNLKGAWTNDEVGRLLFYKNEGKQWKEIGEILGRTNENCRDKYREIGGDNYKERVKKFDLITTLKLFKYVNELVDYKIIKKNYLFKKEEIADLFEQTDELVIIDSSLKEEQNETIILNFLKLILDFEQVEKLLSNGEEILFTAISEKIKIKSRDDLRNYWTKITTDLGLTRKSKISQDLKMIKKIHKAEFIESIEDVDFKTIKNGRTEEDNKARLEELIKYVDVFGVGDFKSSLEKLIVNLSSELLVINKKNDLSEDFYNEIEKRKKFDLDKFYKEYIKKIN